jgi:hypothetical protein
MSCLFAAPLAFGKRRAKKRQMTVPLVMRPTRPTGRQMTTAYMAAAEHSAASA